MMPHLRLPHPVAVSALVSGVKSIVAATASSATPGKFTAVALSLKTGYYRRIRILLLLPSLLLASCAMGPDYFRPPIDTAEKFRMAETEGQSIANLPWWELLQDEELQRLINQALLENRDLKQAVASIEELQARLSIARMDFLPKMDISANAPAFGTLGGFLRPGFPTPYSYFGQTTLNWEVDIWGRLRRSNEAARADLMAREENRRAIVLTLVSSVAQSYFDLLQFDMQMSIALRALSSWEESVAISQAQLRGGVISRLDLDQFEAERANAATRVAQVERQMVQKENELSVLLGKNPVPITRGHSLTEQLMPPEVPSGLPSELLQRRPDILQAEQTLAAATARIGMAKAARFPKLSITGFLGVASPALSNLLLSGSEFGVGGLGLAGPLLNAQSLGFDQRAAEAQARQVLAEYEQTILVAFKEVEDALVAIRTANDQRNAQQEQVKALRSALRVADLRYKGGITSYVDVLLAKRLLFEAEFALTTTHRLHLVSVVQLYKALGGGWMPG
ncbi:multidrug efflux system outer membrane protein [Nitrosospira sp. Nsp5]|uniref:Outer membrane protein, multidrug efflux system n=1 Tax=Nitrosospira multiformis TaxID=1231 RepID=A0ABY0TAW9_9PROT|nr:multidrug efflux system outer membrane protein [Nitrosospira sp. Nsp5]SDQ52306.1 outer membrane protein, multidrug efflux system [Nitrosospira multiformis]